MNSRTTNIRVSDSNTIRRGSRRLSTLTATCATALLLTVNSVYAESDPDLLFSVISSGYTGGTDWPVDSSSIPEITALTKMGTPTVYTLNEQNWVNNKRDGDGFRYVNIPESSSLPFNGGTIVAVARPVRYVPGSAYQCLVSVMLDRFTLGVQRDSGRMFVWRNDQWYDGPVIPNGQITVFSVVVQSDGKLQAFLNGDPTPVMDITDTSTFTTMTASRWYGTDVSVGKGWNGDGWSSFNGDIGDVYVYKTAIDPTRREALEDSLLAKFAPAPAPVYTITASVGSGGTISPSGESAVPINTDQTFTISPVSGYTIADVVTSAGSVMGSLVDINYGGAQTYTFANVLADDSITVTFTAGANPSTRYEAEDPANTFDNAGYPVEWHPNCSGGVCVGKWGDGASGGFTVNVTAPEAGLYGLTVADGGYGDRPTWVKANGVNLVGNPFTPASRNGDNQGTFACTVALLAGANTITVYAPAGQWGPHWDSIDVANTSSGSANKIISSVSGSGGTISPLGDIYCAPEASISFTITPDLYFDVTDVLTSTVGSVLNGPATQTYVMDNVTVADTIVASFEAWVPTYITGTVTAGATPLPGVEITATGPRGPFVTTTSAPAGTYSIQVRPGETYTMTAKKSQYTMSAPQDVLAGGTVNFTATFVGWQPLVALDAKSLAGADGTRVLSWENTGSLGGVFNKKAQGPGPSIATIDGKKAVQFSPSGQGDDTSETLGGTIVTPEALAGNSAWTVYADLYRANMGWNGDSAYLSLAGWWHGYNQCDQFCYVNNKAVDHNGSWWGFNNVPSVGAWHNVTITYDGTTEKIYVDGVLDGSRDIALNIAAGDQILIGSHSDATGPDRLWNDNYWRYSGAIAKLLIFDGALTTEEIVALLTGPPKGTVLMIW